MPVSFFLPVPGLAEAACHSGGVKTEWFFPLVETDLSTRAAREVCAGCPELEPCRRYAVAAGPQLIGVWGGLSSSERQRAR